MSRDVTTPLSGTFVVRQLGLATINLYAKYEASMFTHYEDMKGTKNAKIWVVWGLGVTQGHHQHSHSTSFLTLVETMHLSCTIFEL